MRAVAVVAVLVVAFVGAEAPSGSARESDFNPKTIDLVVCKRVRTNGDCLVKDEYPRRSGAYVVPHGTSYWLWWRLAGPSRGLVRIQTYLRDSGSSGAWTLNDQEVRQFPKGGGVKRFWSKWNWTRRVEVRHLLTPMWSQTTGKRVFVRVG